MRRHRGVSELPATRSKRRFRAQYALSRDVVIHLGVFEDRTQAARAWDIVSWTFRRRMSDLNEPDPKRTAVYDKFADAVRILVGRRVASRMTRKNNGVDVRSARGPR